MDQISTANLQHHSSPTSIAKHLLFSSQRLRPHLEPTTASSSKPYTSKPTKPSHWDRLPTEVKTNIFKHSDPLTKHLNNQQISNEVSSYDQGQEAWKHALKSNWNGDFSLLPKYPFPTIETGLEYVTSKQIYKKLCVLRPDLVIEEPLTLIPYDLRKRDIPANQVNKMPHRAPLRNSTRRKDRLQMSFVNNFFDQKVYNKFDSLLIHVALRQFWLDELPGWCLESSDEMFKERLTLFKICAFYGAVEFGNLECVKVMIDNCDLMKRGIGLSSYTVDRSLRTVCQKGYTELLELLLKPADLYPTFYQFISDAARGGSVDILKRLLEHSKFQWSERTGGFMEVLKLAATGGHVDIVNYLLDNYGDNVDSECLNAAMKVACEMGHAKVVKVLSKFDQIDMIRMALRNGFLGVVKVLVNVEGVDPGACDNEAFRSACKNGHVGVVNVLLRTGCVDPAAGDNEGFREACKNGHEEVVKVLLRVPDVNPSACENEGLRMACKHNRVEVVRVLLRTVGSRRVALSAWDYEAVRFASENRNLAVVRLLVGKGGKDVVMVASEVAQERGLKDVVDMLTELGY
ncbi:hypothetical protein HDU76_000945 [Blyttiomyces sp. JEL0837]|nr:hypothetical protein HDU76_000945 [Blyttiomyces sp. JEL0837]